jgi:hypothetical protein
MFGEELNLNKLYALSRLLAVVVAIAAAFVVIPYVAAILLVLGAVAGLGVAREDRTRLYVVTLLLVAASKFLEGIPGELGTYLSAIFTGLGTAYVGASIVALTHSLMLHIERVRFKLTHSRHGEGSLSIRPG